ncbi:DUF1145 domain-containing protein [Litorivivens sp.]|uniref:DUF1145 domain-containing protein n=1 Tax=Litorivivens sp. TaxID=2020868 RepID=UPI003563489E
MSNTLGKIATLAFWIAAVINLITPFGAAAPWITGIAAALLVAHSIECIYFRKQIQADPNHSALAGTILVLLYGVLHSGQWLNKSKA